MTYYELVELLDSYIYSPRDEKIIDNLNNIEIDLRGDRYFRFIDHISYLIEERLKNSSYNFEDKIITQGYNDNIAVIEFNEVIKEINFINKLSKIKLIKLDNQQEFEKSIKESVKNILNKLLEEFKDDKYYVLQTEIKRYCEV